MLKEEILKKIVNHPYEREIVKLNDTMARNPEISGKEYHSSRMIVELLRKHGIEVTYPYGGLETAFCGRIYGKNSQGPKVCILTEYDALCGIGHGCGHCASGSISVLAALLIQDIRDEFCGEVDIVGTPDEEISGGKIKMAQAGLFDSYDYAIMMHMNQVNTVNCRMLAMEDVIIEFFGKSAHSSASPWEGRNAFNAVQLFFHALDMMRQHVKPDVRIHGILRHAGDAPNIVPEYVKCEAYIRANTVLYAKELYDWMEDCAKGAALATKTTYKMWRLSPPLRELSENPTAENVLQRIYKKYGLEPEPVQEAMGSSDIGEVDDRIPAFHPLIQVRKNLVLHTKEMAEAMTESDTHAAIRKGGCILAEFIMETLMEPELLSQIKNDYRQFTEKYRKANLS